MLQLLAFLSILLHISNAEPPDLLFQGARFLRKIEMAMKEHSHVWEQAVANMENILDARQVIRAMGENTQRISKECSEDIRLIYNSLIEFERGTLTGNATLTDFDRHVILPMLDSSGRIGPAILRGHTEFPGHFSECRAVDYEVEGRTRHFKGEYFRIHVDIAFRDNSVNGSCEAEDTGEPAFPNPVCAVERINEAIPPIDAAFYVTASIMGVIAVIGIAAGTIDYLYGEIANKTGISKALPWRLFMAFSLYSNVSSIFDVSEAKNTGIISPIHCIRFFTMSWVVMGHFFDTYIQRIGNPFDIFKMAHDLLFEFIQNSYFAVDAFFFMSGLLLTFIWFKNYHKNPAVLSSPVSWILFYIHRIIRLSPPFYMMVAFYSFVRKQLYVDLPVNMTPMYRSGNCAETWWLDMLYVHNWWQIDRPCMNIAWYLTSEMQMFLFTPLLIIPLAIKPVIGFMVTALALAISTAANIFLVYYYHWPTNAAVLFTPDPEMTDYDDYNKFMYESPLIRCQIYIMGMLVGWFLQHKRTLRINPLVNVACWVLGLSLMLCVVLGLHDQSNGFYVPIFWRAMYSSLSRIAFGLGLAWIIVSCWYGHGGPVNKFMSWHIWIPFGRLTYCGYLTHIPVMTLILGQSTDQVFFTNFAEAFIIRVVSVIAATFLVSTFWSALFEISFGKIQMILLGGLRPTARDTNQKNVEENGKINLSMEDEKVDCERL